jgi:copper chaperone NosL
MAVSDKHFAAEVVAPGEEPRFYDDIGCLANDVARHAELVRGTAFVADHRTGEWVQARRAVYTRVPDLATPMGSHLIAHVDPPSREADPAAKGGTPTSVTDVFGPAGPPGAGRAF